MQEPADRSRGVLARIRALSHLRLVAAAAVATAFAITVIGAGAAPVGPTPLSDVLGVTGEHGAAVSDAVHQAKDDLEEGAKVGPAVSEAACTEAHNRDTLPDSANQDPGPEDKADKECIHPSNAESDEETSGDEPAATDEAATEDTVDEESNHGQLVSKAVHEAKENLADGEKVGPAVSEAACEAAHSTAGLPENAAAAHNEHKPAKDCTHPSNATDEETTSDSGATEHGKSSSAPGRNK